ELFCGSLAGRPPPSTVFPYTTLFRSESLAALVVGVLVAGAGVQIGWQALEALRQPEPLPPGAVALAAALLSVGVKGGLAAHGERSEEHTSELQSRENLVCRLLLEKKK